MEPTSESDELLDVVKVKNEIISDDEPITTVTEGCEEASGSSEPETTKKFSCPICHKKYNSELDLLNHFRYECEQSGTISAATVSNGLPSLLTNNETSEAAAAATASTSLASAATSTAGISSSPIRHSTPPTKINNHHEKQQQYHHLQQQQQQQQHFLHSPQWQKQHHQPPIIPKFENPILQKTDMSGKFQPPILLPITVHSDDAYSVRIIGPPQFIIPVAVGRKTDLLVSSLHIDPLLAGNISIPSSLPISNGIPDFSIPIHSTFPQQILPPPKTNNNLSAAGPLPIKRPRISTDSRPLDLSLKVPKPKILSSSQPQPPLPSSGLLPSNFLSLASTLNSQINTTTAAAAAAATTSKLPPPPGTAAAAASTSSERRFKCGCGVEFTSETVYIGHKNFYCRLRPQSEEETSQRQPIQKFPEQCSHCDFRPSSSSNLSQHIREQHAAVKAYICSKCGYRGFSARGIRAHLTSHHLIEDHEKYILEDRGNTKIYSCPQCHQVYLAQDQLVAHKCTKKL